VVIARQEYVPWGLATMRVPLSTPEAVRQRGGNERGHRAIPEARRGGGEMGEGSEPAAPPTP